MARHRVDRLSRGPSVMVAHGLRAIRRRRGGGEARAGRRRIDREAVAITSVCGAVAVADTLPVMSVAVAVMV
jgi:hypothetical protein